MSNEKTQEEIEQDQLDQIVQKLGSIAQMLGFQLAIPKPKHDEEPVRGFILGTPEYIEEITAAHAKLTGQENNEGELLEEVDGENEG